MSVVAVTIAAAVAAAAIGTSSLGTVRRRPAVAHRTRARTRHQPEEWPRFLDTVASSVRAGHTLATAVSSATERTGLVPPTLPGRSHRGSAAAIAAEADRAVVRQALQLASEMGGPVASGLQHAAGLLRERATIRAEARAHAAQAHLSALVLTLLPAGFAVVALLTSGSYRSALGGAVGMGLALGGTALNLAGWAWMRRTIGRAVA